MSDNAAIAALIAKQQAGLDREPRLRDSRGEVTVLSITTRVGHEGTSVHMKYLIEKCERVRDDVAPHSPGETFTVVSNISKHKPAAGYVKKAICAVVGADHEKVSEKDFIEAFVTLTKPEQKAKGFKLRYHTERFMTKKGVEMTVAVWAPIPQAAAEIKANRERVEKLGF